MIYKILLEIVIVVFRIYCGIVHPVRVTGKENLPKEGGFMMCVNHISFLDPVITVLYVKRHIRFMGKKELFSNKIVAGVLNAVGAFPVDRGRADLAAIREAIKTLTTGQCLGIFPQGTRSADNEHTQMHGGAALIVQRTGSPVVPMYIDGPYKYFRKTDVVIGKPIDLSAFGKKTDAQTIAQITDAIDGAIWELKK